MDENPYKAPQRNGTMSASSSTEEKRIDGGVPGWIVVVSVLATAILAMAAFVGVFAWIFSHGFIRRGWRDGREAVRCAASSAMLGRL